MPEPLKKHYTERSQTLNAKYATIFNKEKVLTSVDGESIHRGLFSAIQGFDKKVTQTQICSPTAKSTIQKANLLTAGFGFLYSDTPESEGGVFPRYCLVALLLRHQLFRGICLILPFCGVHNLFFKKIQPLIIRQWRLIKVSET